MNSFIGFANSDFWYLFQFIIGHKDDSHSPAGMCAQHSAKFVPREFLIVNRNHGQRTVVTATVVNGASQDTASWRPLIDSSRMVDDLRTAARNFDCDIFAKFITMANAGSNDLVEQNQDFLVGHSSHFRADPEVSRFKHGISRLNDRLLTVTRDSDLVHSGDTWPLSSHINFSRFRTNGHDSIMTYSKIDR